jgi:hypothetical protein
VREGAHSSTRLLAGEARQHQAASTFLIEATLEHTCPLPPQLRLLAEFCSVVDALRYATAAPPGLVQDIRPVPHQSHGIPR